jgi:tripartite-type tricarboxylate transporter receptor subunit TctC
MRALQAFAVAVLAGLCTLAQAQGQFPNKPVRFMVPYAPGGGTDVIARQLGQRLGEVWGQPVVVENKPGGNGIIGTDVTLKSPPDGYNVVIVVGAHLVNQVLQPTTMPYHAVNDVAPVSLLAHSPWVVVVNNDVPVKNLKDLVAYAKANPGKLRFGSSEPSSRLAGELFKQVAGVDMVHVPYKGGSQIMTDLLGGHIEVGFTSTFTVSPHHKAGKLRVLAVAGNKRDAALPDIPTAIEAGLPGYETYVWYGMYAPKGTPSAVVGKIQQDIAKVVKIPEVHAKFVSLGAEPIANTPEQFAAFTRSEYERYQKVIKDGNIKAE